MEKKFSYMHLLLSLLLCKTVHGVTINIRNPDKGTVTIIRIFDDAGNKVPLAENEEQLKNIGCQSKMAEVKNGCTDCCMLFGSQQEMAKWTGNVTEWNAKTHQNVTFTAPQTMYSNGTITLNIAAPFTKIELETYKVSSSFAKKSDNKEWADFDVGEKIKTYVYKVPSDNKKNILLKFPSEPDVDPLLLWPTE